MKKLIALMMIGVMAFAMVSCGGSGKMSLSPSELTDEEQQIFDLMKYSKHSAVLDYELDDTAKSATITTYELGKGGKWHELGALSLVVQEGESGRFSFAFDQLNGNNYISISSGGKVSAAQYTDDSITTNKELGVMTELLEDSVDVEYGKEIPIAIEIASKDGSISATGVSAYHDTKDLVKKKYNHVYVMTVTFSQKAV